MRQGGVRRRVAIRGCDSAARRPTARSARRAFVSNFQRNTVAFVVSFVVTEAKSNEGLAFFKTSLTASENDITISESTKSISLMLVLADSARRALCRKRVRTRAFVPNERTDKEKAQRFERPLQRFGTESKFHCAPRKRERAKQQQVDNREQRTRAARRATRTSGVLKGGGVKAYEQSALNARRPPVWPPHKARAHREEEPTLIGEFDGQRAKLIERCERGV